MTLSLTHCNVGDCQTTLCDERHKVRVRGTGPGSQPFEILACCEHYTAMKILAHQWAARIQRQGALN